MVWCYEVPVKCWNRVKKSQTLISRFLERCSKEEEALVHSLHSYEKPKPLSLTTICFYTDVSDLDLTGYFGHKAAGLSPPTKYAGKLNIQTTNDKISNGQKFAGFFFANGSFNIVKSDSNTEILVYSSESIQSEEVGNVLENVVFSQLTDKCNFLKTRLEHFSAEPSFLQDDAQKPQNTEKREIVDGLIGDIIALFNRSTIEKKYHPYVPGFEVKTIDEKIAQGLFKIDGSIKGVGYRFSKLYIDIKEDDATTKQIKQREDIIKNYLSNVGIDNFQFSYVSQNETLFAYRPGAWCNANGEYGTIGCFACKTRNDSKMICALVSRHVAIKSENIYVENGNPLGTVLRETTDENGYDIAAVAVYQDTYCTNDFRNSEKNLLRGRLHEAIISDDDYKQLQDREVYIWGASKVLEDQPGFGKIFIPKYISSSCDLPHVKVMDQDTKLRMAIPGDSGGIICIDSLEDDVDEVILIAMLNGSTENDECIEDNPGRKREYLTFMLRNGFEQLSQQTDSLFQLA